MADPVTATIAVVTKIAVAVYTAYQASAAVRAVIQIALFVASMSAAKKSAKKASKINQGQELALKLDPNMPRQIATGRVATGGSQVFAGTFTDNAKVPNKYLYRVIDLSDRPITGCVNIFEDGQTLTFLDDVHTSFARCNQHKNASGGWCMWVNVVRGSDTPTASSWLIANSGGQWTSNHKGVGIAYAIVQYAYDQDAFPNGEPQLSFEVDGVVVYDPRDEDQDIYDPSTWQHSRNAALLASQLLIGYATNGRLIAGAGADIRDIDQGSWIAAASTCDIAMPKLSGGTEPQYNAGLMVTSANTTEDDLTAYADAMDGSIFDRGGSITLWPGGVRTPVMDLTDDDIIWAEEKSYQPYTDLSSLYNVVSGSFVASDMFYAEDAFPVRSDSDYLTQDGGQRIVLNKAMRATTSRTQAQRASFRLLKSSRFQKVAAFVGPLWLFELEQGDWFTLTSARWGFTTKYFVVQSAGYTTDLKMGIVAIETSPTIGGWSTAYEVARTNTNTVQEPYALPIPDLSLTPITVSDSGTYMSLPAIQYIATAPAGTFGMGYNVQLRVQGSATTYDLQPLSLGSTSGFYSAGLLPGITYEMRIQAYDGISVSEWTGWEEVTTSGVYRVSDAGSLLDTDGQTILDSIDDALEMAEAAAGDGVLSLDEKRYTLQPLLTELRTERDSGVRVQAVAWSLSTSSFDTAMSTLETYLSTQLTTPVAYNDYTDFTNIPSPSSYQSALTGAVDALQVLRKSVSTEAATRALASKTTYTGGATVDSLKPAEAGSDVTSGHNAAGFAGQSAWATYNGMQPNQIAKPGANLVFDGGLKLKGLGWTTFVGTWNWGDNRGYGGFLYINGATTGGVIATPRMFVNGSTAYTAQVQAESSGATTVPWMYIAWYTSADVLISFSSQVNYPATGSAPQIVSLTATSPSNAAYARVAFNSGTISSGGAAIIARVKFEIGSAMSPFTDDTTSGALYANGVDINSLKPGELGANITETRTASGIISQGALATRNTVNQTYYDSGSVQVSRRYSYVPGSDASPSFSNHNTGSSINTDLVTVNQTFSGAELKIESLVYFKFSAGGSTTADFGIYYDGTLVKKMTVSTINTTLGAWLNVTWFHTPSAGVHTYKLTLLGSPGTQSWDVGERALIMTENVGGYAVDTSGGSHA